MSEDSELYRRLMRKVEPAVFYEDNYFSPHGESADTWRICWLAERGLLLLFLAAAWFGVWWALPLLFFPLSLSWIVRASIEGKAGNGYPELEVGDAIGIALVACVSFLLTVVWCLYIWI